MILSTIVLSEDYRNKHSNILFLIVTWNELRWIGKICTLNKDILFFTFLNSSLSSLSDYLVLLHLEMIRLNWQKMVNNAKLNPRQV